MEMKLLEIRDRGTCIPALAIRVSAADGPVMQRAGFGNQPMVYLIQLATQQCAYDPYQWSNRRTMGFAHSVLESQWKDVGPVLDVRVFYKETAEPARAECV